MDQELSTLKLNINQLAGITGVHRQTVAARLKQVEPAPGSNNKLKLYLITDVLTELMAPVVASSAEDMTPSDRLAHWKAKNERLKFEQDIDTRILETSSGFALIEPVTWLIQGQTLLILSGGRTQFAKLRGRALITDDGEAIEGEAKEEVEVMGRVTFFINSTDADDIPV